MAGKTRPSLRAKTLQNVALSNLSLTDKQCIESVFEKFEALTADVEGVKHGQWLDNIEKTSTVAGITKDFAIGYKCSLCGRTEINREPYCNCGTKMDGGNAE